MSRSDAHEQGTDAQPRSSASDPGRLNLLLDVLLRVATSRDVNALVCEFASQLSWVLDFEHCWFGLLEDDGGTSYHHSSVRAGGAPAELSLPDKEIIGRVMLDRTIRRDEVATESIVLCLPLCVGERTVGAVLLRSRRTRAFDRNDVRFAQAATTFLALALDRLGRIEALARSTRQVQQRNEELATARDTLEQLNVELQSRNKDLDEFAYIASHDLRSPLEGIKNLAKWIADDNSEILPDNSKRHLQQMEQRISRLDRLLHDLLKYSRAGRKHDAIVDVDSRKMIGDIAAVLSPPAGFRITAKGKMPTLRTARTPLEQVLRNLIDNAVKHHDRDNGHVEVSCRDSGAFFEFAVTDDGPGIAPEFHVQIFKMFETLKPRDEVEGSGMGLAVINKIVQSYGGQVTVESTGNRGTTFRFTWPKVIDHASPFTP